MRELKRPCAIVIDDSGSMHNVFLYTLGPKLFTQPLKYFSFCDTQALIELAKKYVKVYFFTDNYLDVRALLMIKLAGNIEVIIV